MRTQVLILGAGPYGIGIAQALFERGIDFVLVGVPFELWKHHTLNTMLLRSDVNSSEIYSGTGRYRVERFLAESGNEVPHRMTVQVFREYLDWVLEELPFEVLQTRVAELEWEGEDFRAVLDSGEILHARYAVVATGLGGHQNWPAALAGLDRGRLLHSWETEGIEALQGERALLIGGGQSAAETVEALRLRKNRVTWVLRRRPSFFSEPLRLPTPLFKLVLRSSALLYSLPRPIIRPLSRLIFRTTITPNLRPVYTDKAVQKVFADAEDLGLECNGEGVTSRHTKETYDRVISATGYRFSLGGLPFLGPELLRRLGPEDSVPSLDRSFRTPMEEFFLAGGIAEGAYGPAQRFILGSWQAAPRIARALSQMTQG